MASDSPLHPSPGLSNLPAEIIRIICCKLCRHCESTDFAKDNHNYEYDPAIGQKALIALSKTSRLFRDIAQPIAHHRLGNASYKCVKLVRTLDERPDLAAQTRELDQEHLDGDAWGWLDDEDDFEYIKSVARKLGLGDTCDPNFDSAAADDLTPVEFFFEFLIAMLPNVTNLRVLLEDEGNDQGNTYIHLKTRSLHHGREATALPHLRSLVLQCNRPWGMFFSNPAIDVILSLSPKLEHLSIGLNKGLEGPRAGHLFQIPPSPYLRTIHLQDCALEDDELGGLFIQLLVRHAPNLEKFSYESQYAYIGEHIRKHLSTEKFIQCLHPVQKSLKFIDINLMHHSLNSTPSGVIKKGELVSFTGLETLKLDDTGFCRHRWAAGGESTAKLEAKCLTDSIPKSLKTLHVRVFDESGAWADLAHLADSAGQFPNLQRVNVDAIHRMHCGIELKEFKRTAKREGKLLRGLFAKTNIRFTIFGGRDYGGMHELST
ncbi:hypothetical protein G7046_g8825 [Stylonectria norvegica]|nr:hypothetical protein G7046_g8825 [Stylonectria norvegica]